METVAEVWLPIKSSGGKYEASSHGRIRSAARTQERRSRNGLPFVVQLRSVVLSPGTFHDGYLFVHYHNTTHRVHRLVAEAFHGEPPSLAHVVNHKNGNKLDNRPDNLEWVTARQNFDHAVITGLIQNLGQQNTQAKLSANQVIDIRRSYAAGDRVRDIAVRFGIGPMQASRIARGERWGHIKEGISCPRRNRKRS